MRIVSPIFHEGTIAGETRIVNKKGHKAPARKAL
jgi:hypothetical protein